MMIDEYLIFIVGLMTFIVSLNRYYWGKTFLIYKRLAKKWWQKRKQDDSSSASSISSPSFTPDSLDLPMIDVIIPCFNEGEGIYATLQALLASNYPREKLKIMVVDDCSQDDSVLWIKKIQLENNQHQQITLLQNETNIGKRKGINKALKRSTAPFILSVDSDVQVDAQAVRELAETLHTSPAGLAAVGGMVKVRNCHENWLTRMQTIKYYLGYEFLKALEISHQQVMCLSGCLTMYRREVLWQLEPIVENRNLLGISIKYGEDRFLTRQIVKAGFQTTLNLKAMCYTTAPPTLLGYLKQQLRWRRSNFVDYLGGITHLSKLRPLVAFHYLSSFTLQTIYPLVVVIQIVQGHFLVMMIFHFIILFILSLFYYFDRSYHGGQAVNPLWFLLMGPLMPITYLLLSPLAFLTLDSGSWETRQKT